MFQKLFSVYCTYLQELSGTIFKDGIFQGSSNRAQRRSIFVFPATHICLWNAAPHANLCKAMPLNVWFNIFSVSGLPFHLYCCNIFLPCCCSHSQNLLHMAAFNYRHNGLDFVMSRSWASFLGCNLIPKFSYLARTLKWFWCRAGRMLYESFHFPVTVEIQMEMLWQNSRASGESKILTWGLPKYKTMKASMFNLVSLLLTGKVSLQKCSWHSLIENSSLFLNPAIWKLKW